MASIVDEPGGEQVAEEDRWTFTGNPAVRALLDHIAEQLATEFVRLIRNSVSTDTETRSEDPK